jgi:hypothetical protein
VTASIAHLKVKLDEVEPAVLRQLEVPLTIRLDRLHLVLQAAMGWTNSHLYEIRIGDVGWGIPDPDFGDGPLDARKTRLIDALEDVGKRSFKYLYDFGDGWEHTIRVERITEAIPGMTYPCLVEATGRCPPEDVGGPWGYNEFLETIANPDHEEHEDTVVWAGGEFRKSSTSTPSRAPSPLSPSAGHEPRPHLVSEPRKPRPSPEGYA